MSSKPIKISMDYIEIPDPDLSLQAAKKKKTLFEMPREANFTNVHAADGCVDTVCKVGSFSN